MLDQIKDVIGFSNVPDAYTMIIALGSNLDPIMVLLGALAYLVGFAFIFTGVSHLRKSGMNENGAETPTTALVIMLIGVLLIYLPSSITTISVTAFGDGAHNALGYSKVSNISDKVNGALAVIYKFIGVAGVAAFIYGCFVLKGTTEGNQNDSVGKGLWHLIGGVGAIYLDTLVGVFKSSIGFGS